MRLSVSLNFLVAFICCLPSKVLTAQQQGQWTATAYHTEEYSELSTYPAACFEDAWVDSTGRLMILTCPPEAADGMHLFAFDGYEFRVIRHPLDSLPADSKIISHVGESTVVGNSGANTVFVADIRSGEIRTLDLPVGSGRSMIYALSKDSIVIASFTDNSIALTTWTRENVSTVLIQNPASGKEWLSIWLSAEDIWVFSQQEAVIYRINMITQKVTPLVLEADVAGVLKTLRVQFKPYWVDGVLRYVRTWFQGSFVLLKLDEQLGAYRRLDILDGSIADCGAFEDQMGNVLLYFMREDGQVKALLELKNGESIDFSPVFQDYQSIKIEAVISEDFNQAILVCHSRGLRTHLIAGDKFIDKAIEGYQVRAMAEISPGQFLVTTQSSSEFRIDGDDWENPVSDQFECLFVHRKLISTGSGTVIASSRDGLVNIDPLTWQCEVLASEAGAVAMATLGEGKVGMINAQGELFEYKIADRTVRPIGFEGKAIRIPPRVHDMIYSGGYLWIASSNGLWKVDPTDGSHTVIGKEGPFTDYHFLCIYADSEGKLWLGSTLGGLQVYDPASGHVDVLDSRNGLPNNTVVTVQEDHSGDFWVATHDGVALVNPSGRVVRVFDELDGLANNESNRHASLVTSSGKVLIGSIKGVSLIDPVAIKQSGNIRRQPRVYITDLEYKENTRTDVHVRSVAGLEDIGEVTLPAKHRSLKARLALSSFVLADQNTYEWKFASQTEWRTLGKNNVLELDDIRPGRYRLQIRGADREGTPTSNTIEFGLRVRHYFYQSWWFYLLCGLFVGGLAIAWILRLRWAVARATKIIKTDKQIIEEQAGRLRELDEAKSRYFTEISHELRTPLTIISGMSAQILDEPEKWSRKGALLIRNNSQRLLKLVNQILDLRKLESSEIAFNMVQGNIVAYLSYLADTFTDYTHTKSIDFSFVPFRDEIVMDYDPERIADIISNLVSNAIKYCQPGDQVRLEVDTEEDKCVIRVTDTGTGIAQDQVTHIFERFYRAQPDNKDVEGTGVGLALVSELVQRLNGHIEVKSALQEGSTFTVLLPVTRLSTIRHDIPEMSGVSSSQEPSTGHTTTEEDSAPVSILVVEDHPDLIIYMQTILESKYAISVAQDGNMGQSMAIELVPDLVISDIMMPGQSGIELCEKLKSDRRTDHIPIILLTAKADKDTKLESLQKGADAFLTKPFDREELLTVIANLLEQRKQLQMKYRGDSGAALSAGQTEPTDGFITELNLAIDSRMEDEDFSVVHLCRAMSMSRTNLHNKIKALTGRSTTGYIRFRRLKRAQELLKLGTYNVSEVAYAVGFKSQSYFSTSYSREFGTPPSEKT